jgi:hypothetical protein
MARRSSAGSVHTHYRVFPITWALAAHCDCALSVTAGSPVHTPAPGRPTVPYGGTLSGCTSPPPVPTCGQRQRLATLPAALDPALKNDQPDYTSPENRGNITGGEAFLADAADAETAEFVGG